MHNEWKYKQYYEDCQKEIDSLTSAGGRISFWRAVSFLVAAALCCAGYARQHPAYVLAAAACLAVFLALVRRHSRLTEKQNFLRNYQSAAKEYMDRFTDDWKQFPEDGARYLDADFPEAKDLDIFGKHSLYQFLCTAGTIWGQDQLAEWLRRPGRDLEEIKMRQQAVLELTEKTEFTMNFQAAGKALKAVPYEEAAKMMGDFLQTIQEETRFPALGTALIYLLPAAAAGSLLLAVPAVSRPYGLSCFLALASAQLMAALIGSIFYNRLLAPVYKMNRAAVPYRRLIACAQQETFESPYLCALQKKLMEKNTAVSAFLEFEKISESVSMRKNLYAFILCNSLYLHDFHCIKKYAWWKRNYRDQIQEWLETAGEMEALISLGTVGCTRKVHVLPQIETAQKPVLKALDIRHPLLREELAAGNDFEMQRRTCIITGSNMSGKTTFMRSIGVNLLLAYAGGFCTAESFRVSRMELCTSMRTEDNVSEGISTFYAELLRIKKMIEKSRQGLPMISLIDEIYKGTNSKDRIYAAGETIRNLSRPYALTILTTHDFELCDLEHVPEVEGENYYFSEHYEKNQIMFDYKIKKGRCKTANARYLLQMAGIIQNAESRDSENKFWMQEDQDETGN